MKMTTGAEEFLKVSQPANMGMIMLFFLDYFEDEMSYNVCDSA